VEMEKIISQNSSMYSRYLIGKIRHYMNRARQNELRPFDISPRQATVLFILQSLGHKCTLAELSKHSDRQINTLSTQITRMEKNGLVRKVRQTPKSALINFELTEKGTEIYNKSIEESSVEQIMSVLTESERQQLISLLKKIATAAEKY
jgi:DNA-binding MarR family transcriptional regulator